MSTARTDFERDGFVVFHDLISAARLAEVREMVDRVLDGSLKPDREVKVGTPGEFHVHLEPAVADDPSIPRREKVRIVFHMTHTHSFFWELATSTEILDAVELLLGPNLRYYTDQMFVKPARHGSQVPWHQDSSYWRACAPNLLSCWLALDDVTIANGCVRFLPGSQRELLPHSQVEGAGLQWSLTPEQVDPSREVAVEMKAGSACLHHSLTAHHSLANTSERSRRGLIMIFLPADLEFYTPWDFAYGFKRVRGH